VHRATSLGPPILPELILHLASGAQVSITFGFPGNPKRPMAVVPLRPSSTPAIRASPDPKRPVRLALNRTNRPMAFLCRQCGRDCLGILPSPSAPLPGWESHDLQGGWCPGLAGPFFVLSGISGWASGD
jgi:hypothetical protein